MMTMFLYQVTVERDMGINRGNKKLLEKLVEISKGKHVCENTFIIFVVICWTPQRHLTDNPILDFVTVSFF